MAVRKLVLGLVMIGLSAPAQALPLPQHGIFVYSDLCIEPQSQDWSGHRLVVVLLDGDTIINYEWSEGGLDGAAAQTSRFDHPSEKLQFQISVPTPAGPKPQTIAGIISREKFVQTEGLNWEGGKAVILARQRNPGTKVPICKPLGSHK
jgi:hypothetical protein